MYRLLDLHSCRTDIVIRAEAPRAFIDTEDAAIAAVTGDGHLIYCNRVFLCKYNVDATGRCLPSIRESLPSLWKRCLKPESADDEALKVINLRLNASNKPLGHLLVSFDTDSCSFNNNDLHLLASVENHPDFINSYAGLYVADSQADTIKVNPSYEKIAFLPESDLVGRNLKELVEKGYFSRSVTLSILNRLKHQRFSELTLFQKLICGKEVLVSGTPIYTEQKELAYIMTHVHDLLALDVIARKCEGYARKVSAVWHGATWPQRGTKSDKSKGSFCTVPKFDTLPLVARDPLAVSTLKQVVRAAGYEAPILLTGETGVGKDLLAKYISLLQGEGEEKPFISVNCSAIPGELLESELFGYEEGAFSGASRKGKAGLFSAADGGIIFLNEISEMPLGLQTKLLTVLDEGCIRPLGSNKTRQVKTRIICATNKDLHSSIKEGTFRSDLYYRINVLTIRISPLRQRRQDILPLVHHFMSRLSAGYGLKRFLSPEVQEILLGYDWPGNVRELRNVVEQLLVFSSTDQVSVCDLPEEMSRIQPDNVDCGRMDMENRIPLKKAVQRFERQLIEDTLEKCGTVLKAAGILGIDPTTLTRKLKKRT